MKQLPELSVLILAAWAVNLTGYSQDSLKYYLELSALNNPGLKTSYLEYAAALEKVPQAKSFRDPEIQLGYFLDPMEFLGGNQVADIRLMQMFPWFGTLKSAKDEASKMAAAKFEKFRNARNELYFNVKASYYKVSRTMKEIEVAEKNLRILHTLEQLTLTKFRSGGITPESFGGSIPSGTNMISSGSSGMTGSDVAIKNAMDSEEMWSPPVLPSMPHSRSMSSTMVNPMDNGTQNDLVNLLRVQMEIHTLENRIASLKDQLITDNVHFNLLLGRPVTTKIHVGDSMTEMPVLQDILNLADSIMNNPMARMYEFEYEANVARLNMTTRMGYPMVGLGFSYVIFQKRGGNVSMMNGKDMVMPMVSLTLPVYRKKYKAMRHEAELRMEAALASAENIQNNLRGNFQQTLQNLYDADRRINLYTNLALLADKSLKLLITSFSTGETAFEEVLRMQQQLIDYQFKHLEAVADKNTAIARLVYLTGRY